MFHVKAVGGRTTEELAGLPPPSGPAGVLERITVSRGGLVMEGRVRAVLAETVRDGGTVTSTAWWGV